MHHRLENPSFLWPRSAAQVDALHRYVWLYNQHLPQKALNHETPVQALKRWRNSHPQLFSKEVRNHPGPDS